MALRSALYCVWPQRHINHAPHEDSTMNYPCPWADYNRLCWHLHRQRQARCSQLQRELQELGHSFAQHCPIVTFDGIAEVSPSRDRRCCQHRYRSRCRHPVLEFARSCLQPHLHLALRAYLDVLSHSAVAMAFVVHSIQKEVVTEPDSLTLSSECIPPQAAWGRKLVE